MTNVIIPFLRDYKMNLIYIFLFIILILIFNIFGIIKDYYSYNINNVFGALEENRGYIVNTDNVSIIKDIQNNFEIEKIEEISNNFMNTNGYYVVLKKYNDVNSFQKYLDYKNIIYYLRESSKSIEISILKKNYNTFSILEIMSIILVTLGIFFLNKNLLINEEKNISLLIVLGYKKINLYIILFLKIILLLTLSIFMSNLLLIFFKISYYFIKNNILKNFLYDLNALKYFKRDFIIFITLIANFVCFKIRKLNVLQILDC